ncbi:hypothetical protein HN371_11195 [Candidatus Poribacteria bacterium]|jgi:hypothetical protein|nr:hypothetical protein [Candidatus Poribacteria bacterium]MBT5531730.1 hypothetical protein [Candidatus Poribacteria bacterium]MBT5712988.1 hypothetical protein [Candidatus Poribacteria bacterium]MBT7096435.1 hypothetical protein [Candidatus Poribacteria bacterium]MBT7808030.1 hypothetical protein [Candidatus Poribacteria bacterium]
MCGDGELLNSTLRRFARRLLVVAAAVALGAGLAGCDVGDPVAEARAREGIDVAAVDNPALFLAALVDEGAILRADVNGDGVVDIVDLVIVAQSFGDVSTDVASLVTILDEAVRWVPGRGPDDDPTAQAWEFSYQITLRNETRETRSARVVWSWFDASGFLVDEVPVNILLQGGQELTVTDIETVRNTGPDGTHTAEVVSATVPGINIDPPPPPG